MLWKLVTFLSFMFAVAKAFHLQPLPTVATNEASNIDLPVLGRRDDIFTLQQTAASLFQNDYSLIHTDLCLDTELVAFLRVTPREGYNLTQVRVQWGDNNTPEILQNFPAGQIVPIFHTYHRNTSNPGNMLVAVFAVAESLGNFPTEPVEDQRSGPLYIKSCVNDVNVSLTTYGTTASAYSNGQLTQPDDHSTEFCAGESATVVGAAFSERWAPLSHMAVYFGDGQLPTENNMVIVPAVGPNVGIIVANHTFPAQNVDKKTYMGFVRAIEYTGKTHDAPIVFDVENCQQI